MQYQNWTDRISAMTASSKNSFLSSKLARWKISIADIYWSDCTWNAVKHVILRNPLDDYIVWYRESKERPWEKVVSMHIATSCSCGRPWIENGEFFGYRGRFRAYQKSYEDMVEWLNDTMRCKFCFYKDQHANGEWAPKSVIKELES